jgi:lipopolysaccharide/colanic/teichoic acid biosynthesis glycosyltransferase
MKRLIDIIASLLMLVILFPILFLVALLVMLSSKGGALFKQQRIGLHGKPFLMYKFRSMYVGADQKGPYFTSVGDKRITKIGSILRKTSIDELPQLWNVLIGDMSLVGPRPDVEGQKELYSEAEWQKRHLVRPGITGLAQSTLRSEATHEQRTALDLRYVDERSLLLDLKIIFWTIKQVVGKGSY